MTHTNSAEGDSQHNLSCADGEKHKLTENKETMPLEEQVPYNPGGARLTIVAILLLLIIIIVSIILGFLHHLVAQFLDLVIVFPIVIGMILSSTMKKVVLILKFPNPNFILYCALLAALLVYGTRLYCDSQQFRRTVITTIQSSSSVEGNSASPATEEIRDMFIHMSPASILIFYIRYTAESGIILGRPGKDGGIRVRGTLFWLLSFVELLVIAVITAGSRKILVDPYCPRCDRWKHETIIIQVPPERCMELMDKIRSQDWVGAADLSIEIDGKNHCDVIYIRCGQCADVTLTVKCTDNGKTRHVFSAALSPKSATSLVKALADEEEETTTDAASEDTSVSTGV